MLVFVILIVLGFVFYPYALALVANRKMISKLRRIAEREAYRIIPLRRFLWIPKAHSGKYDLLIDGRGQVIAVKLVSAVRKNYLLVVRPDSTATVSAFESRPMKIHPEGQGLRSVNKPIKISDIKENFNSNAGKQVEKAILVYPSFAKIIFFDGKTEASLGAGDTVFAHTIYTPYGLEQKMCASSKALPPSND